jgi:tetratricopeptide (TPR) repeat protein
MLPLRDVSLLLLLAACGCSRSGGEPTADAPHDDALVAAATSEDAASGDNSSADRADFARQLAMLTRQAEDHERRGYFANAIVSRKEITQLLEAQYGADAWETRTAQLALARQSQLHELEPIQRAKNDESNAREQRARQLWQLGKRQEALTALSEAHTLAAQVWGEEHYAVASLIDLQARWQIALGDTAAAEFLFRQALTIREKVLTALHPDTVSSTSALGLLLQAGGRTSEAEPLLRQTVERARSLWGENHLQYAVHLNNLAMLLHDMNRNAEAVALLQQTTQIRRDQLGDKHESVAQSLLNTGTIYYADQNLAAAGPLFRQALEIFEPTIGGGQAMTRMARSNLGLTLMAERHFDEADTLLRADLDWIKKELGENHAEYAEGLSRLVASYGNQGRYNEALPLAERAAEIHRKTAGPDDAHTRAAQELVSKVRSKLGTKPATDSATTASVRAPASVARGQAPQNNPRQ